MTVTSKFRGHPIRIIEETGEWSGTGRVWCGHCGKNSTPEGHDACIGTLDESVVMNACCGHGEPEWAYVQFWTIRFLQLRLWRFRFSQFRLWRRQRISGNEAIEFIRENKRMDNE